MAQNAKEFLHELNKETEKYLQDLKAGTNNILIIVKIYLNGYFPQVAIRVRPLNQQELEKQEFEVIRVLDQKVVVLLDPGIQFASQVDVLRKNRNQQQQFAFDFAFDKYINQQAIYETTTSFLIDGVLDGYNATIFAYGATGAGKTYTMVGNNDNVGIMYRSMNDLFTKSAKDQANKHYHIKACYIEIYNQSIQDLLSSDDKNYDLREDPLQGVTIAGITEVVVESVTEIMAILKVGNRNRSKEATGANEVSSRSHAILQVTVEIKDRANGINQEIHLSKFTLVDLAGSERAAATSNRGMRMIQGAKINQSLLVLGNCIQSLAEANEKNIKNPFIPFRGSQLTRLLKDSLGGNCRTIMIANISPAVATFQDTYNTLNYANRAKSIQTTNQRNVLNINNHISNYAVLIENLQKENENLQRLVVDQNNNISSPGIDLNREREILEKLEQQIELHFNEEIDNLKQIIVFDEEIENTGFTIFQMLSQASKMDDQSNESVILREKISSYQNNLNTITHQKEDLEQNYNHLVEKRNLILGVKI